MCGIAGILNRDGVPVDGAVLEAMTRRLDHRGPDARGTWADGAVGLGNTRLAIIDLSDAGRQPMTNEAGDVVVTFNGEIYNFAQLRDELEQAGHRFRSHTDTEAIVHAWEEWGPNCVERFNGMFAFALWDAPRRRLFLARDRYGIKPLYYAEVGGALLFASEIKSFLVHPEFGASVSLPHLLEYFTFQNLFSDGTLFDGVRLLPPGHRLLAENGGAPRVERYWDFSFVEPEDGTSDEEYEEELERLLQGAVERQLVADVDVGAFLSGGMDSGTLTALASERLPYLATFTAGFDLTSAFGLELEFDERERAERMSYLFKTEHYEMVLKAGDMVRCLDPLVWHLEDLRVGQSYPNYYVSKLASRFVKVALAGTGGDELFGGYPWRYYRAVVNADFDEYVEKYYGFWNRLLPNRILPAFFHEDVWRELADVRTLDVFRAAMPQHEPPRTPEDYLNYSMHLEAKTFLHGLLVVEDRLSMAHSLETRVPFLDNDLVDFAQRLPARLKLRHLTDVVRVNENDPGPKTEEYYRRTGDGKVLLRRVLARYVPDGTVEQARKQGFSGPDASWFRGASVDFVREIVGDDAAPMYRFLRPDTVRTLVDEHLRGETNRRLLLWSLICFDRWCRTFLD
jgi:asparagine synthase (glutamine-hydrolysing)